MRIDGPPTALGSARRDTREVYQATRERGYVESYDSEDDEYDDFYDASEEPSPSQVSHPYSQDTLPDPVKRASSSPSATTLPSSSSSMNPSLSRPVFPHSNTTPAGYIPANDVPQGQSRTSSKNPFRRQWIVWISGAAMMYFLIACIQFLISALAVSRYFCLSESFALFCLQCCLYLSLEYLLDLYSRFLFHSYVLKGNLFSCLILIIVLTIYALAFQNPHSVVCYL